MVRSARTFARLLAVLAMGVVVAACTVTPVPEPPNLDPPDATKITFGTSSTGNMRFFGEADALPPGSRLWVVNLDSTAPASETPSRDDGSFEAVVAGMDGDVIRLQARVDDRRSDPVDLAIPSSAPLARAFADCLEVAPERELAFGEVAIGDSVERTIQLSNHCGSLVLTPPMLRAPEPAFEIVAAPGGVSGEAIVELRIRFTPARPGLTEEVLLAGVERGGDVGRLAITLWGATPE